MQEILNQLKIKADIVDTKSNGVMTKYYLRMHPGAKVSKIENCAIEIALSAMAYSKPIIRILPEKGLVAIELLTNPLTNVKFSDLSEKLNNELNNFHLPIVLGKTHDGEDLIVDLASMPHLLMAGTTGSGKSVMLHSILNSLMIGNRANLVLIDPKKVEFSYYSGIKQLMYPVITDSQDAISVLSDLAEEMESRFALMSRYSFNNIVDFNKNKSGMPYIVVVIDEFSDFMQSNKKEFQQKVCILAQKARACGIHIAIATQRPSSDVITGLIKANFPARISCKVASAIDSRIILNSMGAERLLGKGDSLISSAGQDMVRFQGAFLDVDEIKSRCLNYKRSSFSKIINFFYGDDE